MHENMAKTGTELSREHFTKEFPGFEIESKWTLLTQNPVPVLLKIQSDVFEGKWLNFGTALSMGTLSVGIRFFDLIFQFWGVELRGNMEQIAMVACMPGNRYQLAFKSHQVQPLRLFHLLANPPMIRPESRTGKWITYASVIEEIKEVVPLARFVGEMRRLKCFTYITNIETFRNFSISADLCYSGPKILSQIEVEYKGRRGCWLPDKTGDDIIRDFSQIHSILKELYGDIISPTSQTKFKWRETS